jgi:DNA replication protein DnaC
MVDQLFNLIFLGPSCVGKTLLATGLGIEAIYSAFMALSQQMVL